MISYVLTTATVCEGLATSRVTDSLPRRKRWYQNTTWVIALKVAKKSMRKPADNKEGRATWRLYGEIWSHRDIGVIFALQRL